MSAIEINLKNFFSLITEKNTKTLKDDIQENINEDELDKKELSDYILTDEILDYIDIKNKNSLL